MAKRNKAQEYTEITNMSENTDVSDWEPIAFWLERTYLFQECYVTEYSWPTDRIAMVELPFKNETYPNSSVTRVTVNISDIRDPDIQKKGKTIDEHLELNIAQWKTRMANNPHLHLFKISANDDFFGIYAQSIKCNPVEDHYCNIRARWQEREDREKTKRLT